VEARTGRLKIIETQSLLILEESSSIIKFSVGDWKVELRLEFETKIERKGDSSIKDDSSIRVIPKDDHAVIKFINWDGMAMSTPKPVVFGETDDIDVSLLCFGQKIGNLTKLDIQIVMEVEE